MLSCAELSYIDIGELVNGAIAPPDTKDIGHPVYYDMTRYGTYTDDYKIFLYMMQGSLKKSNCYILAYFYWATCKIRLLIIIIF